MLRAGKMGTQQPKRSYRAERERDRCPGASGCRNLVRGMARSVARKALLGYYLYITVHI